MATQNNTSTVVSLGVTDEIRPRSRTLVQKALYRIMRDRLTITALIILLTLALLALFAPVINEQILGVDPFEQAPLNKYQPIGAEGHILGTDELGRDHLARLLYAGRISLSIAFAAAILALTIGVVVGAITGYYGGIVDDIVIWFITTLNSIPSLYLLLIISALLAPGASGLILVFGFLGWTGATRLVRGETFALREREYIIAAHAIGASDLRIMFLHVVPNAISLVIVALAQSIGALILAESALSFLGFGVKPPTPTWGNMLSAGLDLLRLAPHLVIAPGLLISVTVLCLYIIGDGLRDAFDPRISD